MEPAIFLMVLAAAGLHATWNILLKTAADGEAAMAALTFTYALGGVAMIFHVGFPGAELWPLLALSMALHVAYNLALVRAYREGDFSRAYPVSRGAAPLLAAVAAMIFLGETMNALQWCGMTLAAGGVLSLSLGRGLFDLRKTATALLIAVFIAAYSAADAAGIRLAAKSSTPLLYVAWAFALDGFAYCAAAWLRRGPALLMAGRKTLARGVVGGALAFAAYGLALLAYAQAPVGLVAAVRETSIIIGAFYGALVLREGFVLRRTIAAAATAAGLGILLAG